MSKRSVERRNHDERQQGRHVHLARSMREEGRDRCACDHCDRTILAAQIKRCGTCGESFCAHCLKGSHCDACERDFAWDMDVLDACLSGRKAPSKEDEPLPTDSHYDFLERWEEDEIGSDDMDDY